ncbi:branched-chain amino acid ABC transporter permease [Haematobacter massiliensis]|uniref:Branched-chain amino acid ABC transporter n=1 Tax=Haematobacter massiliensis TaxID=195105 RepID=A0A086Y527_9RHOB|nr:branched-chain amino acid ABC transporter permease [Haematobacter massiliensis]KFI29377.1 branched-chain amino acid ABC transporter [Haematobacter massiliensis]OWJ71186.1 branched-chain amino acid ABC transporter permease [Haematobacter massiliensis]OWJ84275.1 branched-chain amino acid ABC transporter permease [Haematobacter massiliensis]QBJ25995.1 branched-chain amino acid ABC transporter permease [Haematobacter massiliensis]
MTELIIQSLYSGVLIGAYYALIALGLALVFGTMRIINLAHGELVLLAGYIAYTAESQYGLNPIWALPFAVVIVSITSVLVYLLLTRIKTDREINSLILTFGIGIALTNAILLIWSADVRSTNVAWYHEPFVMADTFYAMKAEVLAALAGAVMVAAVWWWLNRSWYGRALRAVSSNRDAAKLMGINPRTTEVLSFGVAGLLAAIAGVALYTGQVIQPSVGHALTIKAFVITVLAGLGSVPGVLVGAILIGIAESLTATLWSSALQPMAGMVLFLVVLLVMPSGLFGRARRRG